MNPSRRALTVSLWLMLAATAHAQAPTEATLSLFEPAGEGCEWLSLDPLTSARRVLVHLEVGCQGGATALSGDGKRGAARFWRGGVSSPVLGRPSFPEPFPSPAFRDRLFLVELSTGASEELPLPPASGELIEFGFDAKGQLFGLTLQRPTPEQEQAGSVTFDTTTLRFEIGGRTHPLLTHAFVWGNGTWTRREVKLTTESAGTGVLELRKELGPRSNRALDPRFTPEEIASDGVLDQLYPSSPEEPDGEWVGLKRGAHSLALWGTPFGEQLLATGLVRRVEKGKVLPLASLGFHANDLVSLQARGALLLVSLADSGAHPRLYRGRKLLWSSETARAVTFWPR